MANALRAEGFWVEEVEPGDQAVAAVTQVAPDVVLLDLCRPGLAGAEFCRGLHAASSDRLRVLHLSVGASSSDRRFRALDAGADRIADYPFTAEFVATIRRMVGSVRNAARENSDAVMNAVLTATVDALADHVALLAPDGRLVGVNRAWADFATANGCTDGGNGLGTNYCDVCDAATGEGAADAHAMAAGIRRVLSDELPRFEMDYACHSPTEQRWFRVAVGRVEECDGIAAVVTHSLVTRQHQHEQERVQALVGAEQDRLRLSAMLEAIPAGAWIADVDGLITHSNAAAARIWGGTAPLASDDDGYAEYKGWSVDTGLPLADGDWALSQAVRSGETVPEQLTEIQRFDGTRGYILSTAAPIVAQSGARIGSIAISVDASERQAAIREREKLVHSLELERSHLAAIFEQASAFFAVLRGPEYVFDRVNPAYRRLVGGREVVGSRLLDALPEVAGQGFIELLDQVMATGESFVGQRVPMQRAPALGAPLETRYVNFVYQRLTEADGTFSLVAHGNDVTDEVVATEALRRSEARLRDQFAKLPGPTLLWEERGREFVLVDANEAAYRAFPRLGAAPIGMLASEITPDSAYLDDDRRQALRENTVIRRSLEFDVGAPIGVRSFDITIGPQQPNRVLVHWVDTTERIALEAQLRQSQKLDAIGQLAGGIAHDFNNLLTVITGYAGMLLEELPADDERRLSVVEIEHAARRAADLTRQLLTFSRKEQVSSELLDLNASVRSVERLIPRLIGSDVTLDVALGAGPFPVIAGSGQVGQLLMNTVVNANDAMPNGGSIRIETMRVELDEAFVQRHAGAAVGPHIRLCIQDTGHGMSEETRAHAFDPFFTTKGQGKGTGLGLSVVYGIVQQWHGCVEISSTLGAGTTISIYVPVADATPEQLFALASTAPEVAPTNSTRAAPELSPAGITILLVDDDDAVRAVVRRVLTSAGYVVLEAASGIGALRLLDESEQPIDIVLSDMVMPGMGGRDLAYEVRVRYPAAMLVLMSGHTHQILPLDDPLLADTRFLQKPFMSGGLLAAISDVLAVRAAQRAGIDTGIRAVTSNDRQALDALVNGIDAVVWESDAHTDRYHYTSRRAHSLLGYPREDWHREGFWQSILHVEDRERVVKARRRSFESQDCATSEYRLMKADGGIVWVRDVVCVISRDRDTKVRLGGVMFDVTVTREAMAELTRAKESAERSDAAKSQFLKLVSHELNTPLNAIIGFSNVLRKNRSGSLTEQDLNHVGRIVANGESLLTLIRNVLDITRMQAGTLELESLPVSLGSLVAESMRSLEPEALRKQLHLHAAVQPGLNDVWADPARLGQVLTNLIGNAIKYTDAGSVSVRVLAEGDGVTPSSIEILDSGAGISPDKLDVIFSAFHQEENFTQRRHDGTGMGLGIARGLCEQMGFHLTISSELGEGTRCTIALRAA